MEHHSNDLLALAGLLKPHDADSEDDDDQPVSGVAALGPGSIGPPNAEPKLQQAPPATKSDTSGSKAKDIWDADEIPAGSEYEDLSDPRPQPEYDIIFLQDVSTEDIFLQMGSKNLTSASCPFIKISIKLPDTQYSDVKLDVTEKFLDCRSPKFKLGLHLPHPVDCKNGKAEWDGDKEVLKVTLKLNREYDFLNS